MKALKNTSSPSSPERRWSILFGTSWRTTFAKVILVGLVVTMCLSVLGLASAYADSSSSGSTFASSTTTPLLQFPEGITSGGGVVYVATFNVNIPSNSRIFAFKATDGTLLNTLGGKPGQGLISAGALLGLTIDQNTGDLYAAANFTGQILHIRKPLSANPQISVYATVPSGGGPEDLVFYKDGTLFASDSNLGVVYAIPPGGGTVITLLGPPSSGALISDNALFASPVQGLSPNGIVFSADWKTLYVANTWADSIIAFDVQNATSLSNPRIFAQHVNDDLEEFPTDFTGLILPDTKIGPSASTPLNGPDGLALDDQGRIWVASNLGDNLTVLDKTGQVVTTFGTSAVTANGLLNQPSGMTFVGTTVYCTNLSIFTGLAGTPNLPFTVTAFNAGVSGAGGNGNY